MWLGIQGLLYSGLLEELVELLEMKGDHLMEIKAAALKSLTSIIHLDRNPNFPKLNTIIDVTGAASFHGFLPVMVRNCITSLTSPATSAAAAAGTTTSFPQPLATALFSFLYHLASYEAGGEALVSCGMMESLLKVRFFLTLLFSVCTWWGIGQSCIHPGFNFRLEKA